MENLNAEAVKKDLKEFMKGFECCNQTGDLFDGLWCCKVRRELIYDEQSEARHPECNENCKDYVSIPQIQAMRNALALITSQEQRIKELAEENERLKTDLEIRNMKRASIFEIADAFDRGRIKGKADTVRKMQERLRKEAYPFPCAIGTEYAVPYCKIDQITKEMLEGENAETT